MKTAFEREKATRVEARYGELWTQAMRYTPGLGLDSDTKARLRARAEREVADRLEVERERAFRAAVEPILPLVDRHEVAALTEYVEALAIRWDTSVIWQRPSVFPSGAAAFADWQHRRITLPILEVGHEDRFAVALHEQGHIVAGPCTGRDHYRDPHQKDWHRCLACETSAWRWALRLAPQSCLELVHARLRSSLEQYSETTPGPREAFRALEELRGGIALLTEKQKRREGLDYYKRIVNQWRTT